MEIDPRVTAALAAHQRLLTSLLVRVMEDKPAWSAKLAAMSVELEEAMSSTFAEADVVSRAAFQREVNAVVNSAEVALMRKDRPRG